MVGNLRIEVSKEAAEKILNKKPDEAKLILNLNDGAGKFSDLAGSCSLDLAFDLVFVGSDEDLHEYTAEVDSDIGTFYVKPYSLDYLDQENHLRVSSMGMLVLSGTYSGIISGNVPVKDKTTMTKH